VLFSRHFYFEHVDVAGLEGVTSTGSRARRSFFIFVNLLMLAVGGLGIVLHLLDEFPNWWNSLDSLPLLFRWAGRSGIVLVIVAASVAAAQLGRVY